MAKEYIAKRAASSRIQSSKIKSNSLGWSRQQKYANCLQHPLYRSIQRKTRNLSLPERELYITSVSLFKEIIDCVNLYNSQENNGDVANYLWHQLGILNDLKLKIKNFEKGCCFCSLIYSLAYICGGCNEWNRQHRYANTLLREANDEANTLQKQREIADEIVANYGIIIDNKSAANEFEKAYVEKLPSVRRIQDRNWIYNNVCDDIYNDISGCFNSSVFQARHQERKNKESELKSGTTPVVQLLGSDWTLEDLNELKSALNQFSRLLEKSKNNCSGEQSIKFIGKFLTSFKHGDDLIPVVDTKTYGEYLKGQGAILIYDRSYNSCRECSARKDAKSGQDSKKIQNGFRTTIIHELSHGLIERSLYSEYKILYLFGKATKLWENAYCMVGNLNNGLFSECESEIIEKLIKNQIEPPITNYGLKNAAEDLAESVSFFFTNEEMKEVLKKKCPIRYRFIQDTILPILDKSNDVHQDNAAPPTEGRLHSEEIKANHLPKISSELSKIDEDEFMASNVVEQSIGEIITLPRRKSGPKVQDGGPKCPSIYQKILVSPKSSSNKIDLYSNISNLDESDSIYDLLKMNRELNDAIKSNNRQNVIDLLNEIELDAKFSSAAKRLRNRLNI